MTTQARALAIIEGWDFSSVVQRAIKDGLPEHEAPAALRQLRDFFTQCALTDQDITPQSPACDDLWHAFVLDTRAYVKFCTEVFGEYLHHDIGMTSDVLERARENTIRIFGLSGDVECGRIGQVECGRIAECGRIKAKAECGRIAA